MTRGSMRGAAACLLMVLTAAMVAWGRNGVVTTKDGKSFEGEITEKTATVEVMMRGNIPLKLNKANVASIEYAPPVKEEFARRMAKLGKTDAAGRIEIARWALEKREYDLSIDALDAAIAIDPNNEDARQLLKSVESQRKLARNAAAKAAAPAGGDPAAARTARPAQPGRDAQSATAPAADDAKADAAGNGEHRARAGKLRLVTPAEINRIRQLELQKGELVQIRLLNDVKRRYLASSEFTPQEFAKMTPQQQAFEILNNGSSKLHTDVLIGSDPASIGQFKSAVQRNVLPGCASASCHGGSNAGPFTLHNPATKDADVYTNFLLIQDFKTTIDGKEYAMVDRPRPEDSLVLLFGLPEDATAAPHPKVQNYRPIWKGKNDPKYKAVLEWLSKTLATLPPEYGIDLSRPPEEADSTTRPAARGGAHNMKDEDDGDGSTDAGAAPGARRTQPGARPALKE